jgi:tripeptidyl-peptidase-1
VHEVDSEIVEYTPQAYLQPDLDMFQSNFSEDLVGVAPHMISIDGGPLESRLFES